MDDVSALLNLQMGVISRTQALGAGATRANIRRDLRRREWARVFPGVYVTHTGPMTWLQRAWAAVLFHAPAALCQDSALRAVEGPGRRDHDDPGPIHVAVDRSRTVSRRPGIVVHQTGQFQLKVLSNTSPPRLRIEHAALDVAASAPDDLAAIAVLSRVVGSRHTTAVRLLEALEGRSRIARRGFLGAVLTDVAGGTCSVLEHSYLTRVERPHGLPRAGRQVRDSLKGTIYRDVDYHRYDLVVELDGRLFHGSVTARDSDLERDLDTQVGERTTVRLGWGQAHQRPCATAYKLAQILNRHGWEGRFERCPDCPDP